MIKKIVVRSLATYLAVNYVAVVRMQMEQTKEIAKLKKQKADSEAALTAACALLQLKGVDVRGMLYDAQFNAMTSNLDI